VCETVRFGSTEPEEDLCLVSITTANVCHYGGGSNLWVLDSDSDGSFNL